MSLNSSVLHGGFSSVQGSQLVHSQKPGLELRSSQDPFYSLSSEKVDEYAALGLEWFQLSLEESASRSPFEQAINSIEKKGLDKFTDTDFLPKTQSLVGENSINRSNWKVFTWLRPSEFMNGEVDLFVGKIDPCDIKQGLLGDCYFLSTLASIAENPNRIKKLFHLDYQNKREEEVLAKCKQYGIYCVTILDMGVPKEVIIDDYFPCISIKQGPAFTRAHDNELWVLILEKAWAKLYGSYNNIEAGLTRECLHDLTKAPTKTIWTDEAHLWENIIKGESQNWVMTAGSNDDENESVQNNGIVLGHAYSLLAGYEINVNGKKVNLVKLRNPWGQKEWNGPWSDNSNEWSKLNPNDRAKLNLNRDPNDGIFFMEFSDFKVNFSDCQFCLVNDNFKYNYVTCTSTSKNGQYFRVYIKKKGKYFFTVNLESKRKFSQKIQDEYQYPISSIVVGKVIGENKFQYVEGKQKADREVWTALGEDEELSEGEYIVYVKVQWKLQKSGTFCLSIYGEEKAEIYTMLKDNNCNFLRGIYMDYARRISKNRNNLSKYDANNAYLCIDQTDDGYAFAACWNNENNKNIKLRLRVKNLKDSGMRVKGREDSGKDTFDFELNPKNKGNLEGIVLIRVRDYANKNSRLSFAQQITVENV